jgi:hypothetical protein
MREYSSEFVTVRESTEHTWRLWIQRFGVLPYLRNTKSLGDTHILKRDARTHVTRTLVEIVAVMHHNKSSNRREDNVGDRVDVNYHLSLVLKASYAKLFKLCRQNYADNCRDSCSSNI